MKETQYDLIGFFLAFSLCKTDLGLRGYEMEDTCHLLTVAMSE